MTPASHSHRVELRMEHVAGSVKRLVVDTAGAGWRVLEEQDNHIVRETVCSDWHRVERARRLFELDTRTDRGWRRV